MHKQIEDNTPAQSPNLNTHSHILFSLSHVVDGSSSVLQARWRFLAGVLWPPGSVPCSTALEVTSSQTSCLEAAPSTISNTTATSCWPQLSGEKILRTTSPVTRGEGDSVLRSHMQLLFSRGFHQTFIKLVFCQPLF